MKNVVLFFLSLCVQLVGMSHYAQASGRNTKVCFSPAVHFEKNHEVKNSTPIHKCLLTYDTDLGGEDPNAFSIEDENEDEDFIKKHVSQARYLLAICYAFILHDRLSSPAELLPFCTHLSYTSACKYITQRALLI